jgi:hypothetical protein
MPESEPKPKLIELVAPGAGQGWKAVLKNGRAVVIHEIPVPAAEAAAAIPRIQRLFDHPHPALSPVLAWGTDPNGMWVANEPNEGVPLGTILARGPLTPPAAAALGAALLSGVAALHEAGIAMGGFGASAVRVTGNGEVRLSGHPAAAVRGAPSQSDLRADVRSCGMAVCAAFGVDPAGAPAPPNVPPGLVVTMRSMASGAMGPAADRAQGALREMASALLAPDRMTAAQSELATRAGGREMPSITPFLPKQPAPAPTPPPAPFVPSVPREETPRPAPASYDAPPRMPEAYTAPPAPVAPVPAPAPAPPAPGPPSWQATPPAAAAPAPPAWQATPPPAPAPPSTAPPAAPNWQSTNPPAPAPPAPAAPEAPATPAAPSWRATPPPASAPPTSPPSPFQTNPPATAPPDRQAAPPPTNPPTFGTPAPSSSPFGTSPPSPFSSSPPASRQETAPPRTSEPSPAPHFEPVPPEPAKPSQTWTAITGSDWPAKDAVPTEKELKEMQAREWAGEAAASETAAPAEAPAPSTPIYTPPSSTPTPAPEPARVTSAPARKPTTVARRPVERVPSQRPTWMVPAIIGVVLLLLIGTVGGIFLASRGSHPGTAGTTPTPGGSPHPTPKASPTPSTGGPQAVPNYAPSAADPVTSVVFCQAGHCVDTSADTACQLGGSCRVTVEIKFSTVQRANIAYIVKFFDRCAGTTVDLPGGSFTPPGFNVVDITAVPPLPTGAKSAAIVAVTTSPASAASAPLLLGAQTC